MRFDFDNSIGYALNRCTILLRIKITQSFRQNGYDITPEEWVVLNRLWQKEGRSQNELAETTIKDKTTITRLLDRMEKKGLIFRQNSSEDRRVKFVYPSLYAENLQHALIPLAKEVLSNCVTEINEEDIQTTLSVLKRIEHNLLDFEQISKE